MAGIKEMMKEQEAEREKEVREREELKKLRERLKREAVNHPNETKASMIQGQLSHFFRS
ncbi:hypothetical protein JCM19037_169 [Geomicrobium sp. JCM 19037]|nr:hypothetical protein [Geomicrobium sp. JCM 19037]GAK01971.1 hypothetical protein JCM19037_169 [Geomicrobium sp. JCM 19037]